MNERVKERRARLLEIERELAQLKKKKRVLEKDYPKDIPEEFPSPRRTPRPAQAERERPASGPAAPAGGGESVPEWAVTGEEGDRRERFASYFMTGGMGHAAPQLRKERRAMKNKAILMAIVALFLLIVLAYSLLK